MPRDYYDPEFNNFIYAIRDAAKVKIQDFLDHISVKEIGSDPEVQEQFKRWVTKRNDILKAKGYEESNLSFWFNFSRPNFVSRGKFSLVSPVLNFLYKQGLAREETRSYTMQIARWEAEEEEENNRWLEAPPRRLQPKPGSDHAQYE